MNKVNKCSDCDKRLTSYNEIIKEWIAEDSNPQLTEFETKAIWNNIQIALLKKEAIKDAREWIVDHFPHQTECCEKPRAILSRIIKVFETFE